MTAPHGSGDGEPMSLVLTKDAVLGCSHQGQIPIGNGDSRLTINGVPVAIKGQESNVDFTTAQPPCQNTAASSPFPLDPCITQPDTSGLAAKLSVGGIPVLLDSAAGTTLPKAPPAKIPSGTWSVADAGQTKLTAAAV